MKENGKKYNATDFARYHSGAMPPEEMHALERAALEDPFLADTLDGYAWSKEHEKELSEIRQRLAERKKKKPATIFSLAHHIWWKIAAMLIIIAGTGYFLSHINSQKEGFWATKEGPLKKEEVEIKPQLKGDTTVTEGTVAFEKPSSEKQKNIPSKSPAPRTKSKQAPQDVNTDQKETEPSTIKEPLSTEQFTDTLKQLTALNKKPAKILLLDTGEESFFRPSDSISFVAVSRNKSSEDSANVATLDQDKPALAEVVVTGYRNKRRAGNQKKIARELSGKVSGIQVDKSTPYPKEGKEKFDKYIQDHGVPLLDSSVKRIPVDILLSFTLNKKGNPIHIKVLESSCKPCDAEAIRLLKNGPDWVGKPGEEGKVRIQF